MGVKHLWATLNEIKQSRSLLVSATEERTAATAAGQDLTYMIGVDMGTLMAECNAGARAAGIHNQRAGGGLYIFYRRLTEFLEIPAYFIFILDGAARPRIKRGRTVRHQRIWWTDLAIQLIEHFGYITRQAPAEAEAELALLNAAGIFQVIITSDSDAVLFGAEHILRSIPRADRQYDDEYLLYHIRQGASSGASDASGFPLTQGNLLLFALLCGGDYDNGIVGCGPATAKGLARCGYGERLLNAFRNLQGGDYQEYLNQWRDEIRLELSTNSRGFLPQARPHLAAAFTDNFPSRRVISLYVDPITSATPGYEGNHTWNFGQPEIARITEFCMRHFNWNRYAVLHHFSEDLWRGVFLQILYSTWVIYSNGPGTFYGRLQVQGYPGADIVRLVHQVRRGQYARMFGNRPMPKLSVSVAEFIDAMGPLFSGAHSPPISVWLPAPLNAFVRTAPPDPFSNAPPPPPITLPLSPSLELSTSDEDSDYEGGQDPRWIRTTDGRWFIDLSEDVE